MKTKEELRDDIAFLDAHLVAIDKGSESRSLDADEQIRFDEGLAARTEAKNQLDQIEAREAQVAELARTAPASVIDGDGNKGAPNMIVRNDPFDMSEVRWNAPVGEVRSKA